MQDPEAHQLKSKQLQRRQAPETARQVVDDTGAAGRCQGQGAQAAASPTAATAAAATQAHDGPCCCCYRCVRHGPGAQPLSPQKVGGIQAAWLVQTEVLQVGQEQVAGRRACLEGM